MNLVDIIIISIVAIVFVLCVRSMVKSSKQGECADCASGSSCNAHKTGHCHESQELMKNAAAAAQRYESSRTATK